MIFDSHAHYDDERFDQIREDVINDVCNNGVSKIVNIGSSLTTSKNSIDLSEKYPFMYATVGVHPSDAERDMQNKNWLDTLEKMYTENKKVVAIGEIGLDYYYGADQKDLQLECFEKQIILADKLGAKVVIHDREAHQDTLDMLKKYPDVCVVVHSFSGSFEMAKELIKCGHYISVNGVVTFKNAKKIVEVVSRLREISDTALDRLLVETDCPYLAPTPFRGQINRSDFIKYTADTCAQLLGITPEKFCDITYKNACRFYGLE